MKTRLHMTAGMRRDPCFIGLHRMHFNLDKSITFRTKGDLPGGLGRACRPFQARGEAAQAVFNPPEISLPLRAWENQAQGLEDDLGGSWGPPPTSSHCFLLFEADS